MESNTEPIKDFGVIVNNLEADPEELELQKKIADLEMSRINLRVSPAVFDQLNRMAELKGQQIEDYCVELLRNSLSEKIGQAFINKTSQLNGAPAEKITGPTFSVRRGN